MGTGPAEGRVMPPTRARPLAEEGRLLDSARRTEDPLDALNSLVSPSIGAISVVLALACLLLVVAVVALVRRTSRLERRLQGVTRGAEGQSLESVLDAHLDKVYAVSNEVDELVARAAVLEGVQRRAIQRVGLVRYNPFDDTGGNQSFAIALLDANGDGMVVSSLHARGGTRIYAKAVAGGKSETALSEEEADALRRAMTQGPGTAARPG